MNEQPWDLNVSTFGGATYWLEGGNLHDDKNPRPLLAEWLGHVDSGVWYKFDSIGVTIDCKSGGDVELILHPMDDIKKTIDTLDIEVSCRKVGGYINGLHVRCNHMTATADMLTELIETIDNDEVAL